MDEIKFQDFNRRDFLKSGSLATLMTMVGGVELVAQTNTPSSAETKPAGPKVKVAVIGLGTWGRELINTLAVQEHAEIAAICDTYPASLRRIASAAPGASQTEDYKTILDNKEIKAVIVATPTYQHKDIVLAALKAGKHVYCEAPLATTIEDAKAIASAAKAAKTSVFQAGLQLRSEIQRSFLLPFIRSGNLGTTLMSRAQWHKKVSWRATSPKPEREKELNWRLSKATSIGLIGELGIHPIDQASWFFNALPLAVSGTGGIMLWKDDREVPDTVRAQIEFPGGVFMDYNATLANSFEGEYEMLYGSDASLLLRDGKAWMFKEVDSPLFGWEIYASKDVFGPYPLWSKEETLHKETGILLQAGKSKSPPATEQKVQTAQVTNPPLAAALEAFILNARDMTAAVEVALGLFGPDDPAGIAEQVGKVPMRSAAGCLEGYRAAVTVIKANEAIVGRQRIELKPEWYELA